MITLERLEDLEGVSSFGCCNSCENNALIRIEKTIYLCEDCARKLIDKLSGKQGESNEK